MLTLISLALTVSATLPQAEPADLILTGGKIATLARGHGFVEAISICDGLVQSVGSTPDVLRFAGEGTKVIDLEGRTVLPGLNDSHSHVVRGGRFYNLELRWDGVPTLADGLRLVGEQAQRTPEGQWVRVIGGWSPFQFAERRMPTIAELNEAAPDTPVFVLYLYSAGFLNAAAVRALGLTLESEPPPGGRYRFVDGGAELIAAPNPTVLYKTIAQLPHLSEEDQINSSLQYYRELARFGLTSASDAGGGGHQYPDNYGASQTLAAEGRLPMRVSFFLFPQRPGMELEDFRNWTADNEANHNSDRAKAQGFVLEGGGEFLAWSAGDFENFLSSRPALRPLANRQLTAISHHLVHRGWPFRIHATYGESIEQILDVFERVDQRKPLSSVRWIIDHAETIQAHQIQRVQRMGGGIAIQNRMSFAGEYFLERYGPELTAQSPPLRALFDSGIPLGGGSDATRVSSYNPWLSLHWMVSGKTVGGTVLYPPENRLSRLEALQLYTTGSAWVSGEEDQKGRLMPGQFADLVVLSEDYFEVPEDDIPGIESLLTVVDGDVVYGAGPFSEWNPPLPTVSPSWSPVAVFGGFWKGD